MNYKNLLQQAKLLINNLQLDIKLVKVVHYHFFKEVLRDKDVINDIFNNSLNDDYTDIYNSILDSAKSYNLFNEYNKLLAYLKVLSHTDKVGISKINKIEKLMNKVFTFEKVQVGLFYEDKELKVNDKVDLKVLKEIEGKLKDFV